MKRNKTIDIEKLNRDNFKSIMNALSMPGNIEKIEPFYSSNLLAVANCLLYSEVSYFYEGSEDFDLVNAITNATKTSECKADYIFCDELNDYLLNKAKIGTSLEPEFSGTLIFKCKSFDGLKVKLSGCGIDKEKILSLPIDKSFMEFFNEKNSYFPLGNEVFFIDENSQIIALSRTTKVEVI
jgi:alpha-D-ribose 1-methylphosphonate 5-triphosphate synthase subunit PhnH